MQNLFKDIEYGVDMVQNVEAVFDTEVAMMKKLWKIILSLIFSRHENENETEELDSI